MAQANPSTLDILTGAKELLNKPGGYIQGRLYNNCGGYCALGALYAVNAAAQRTVIATLPYTKELGVAQELLSKHSPDRSLVMTNNYRDLNAVNEMFCGAIKEEVSRHANTQAA